MHHNHSKGRDTTSFLYNATASLKICHKNAIVNENSFMYEIAKKSAEITYSKAIEPIWQLTKDTLYTNLPESTVAQKNKEQLSKKELNQNRLNADLVSKELSDRFEQIESEIKKYLDKKKVIDNKEKKNKDEKIPPLLSSAEILKRLELIEKVDNLVLQKVELSKGHIQEHALRRLDIMFLLMIAVYKKNVTIRRGKTDRQHGKGSKTTGTAACHACLIPHPILEPINNTSDQSHTLFNNLYLFFTPRTTLNTVNIASFESRYIYDLCNLTNELSNIVNEFDGHLEGKWIQSNAVQASISLLNKIAIGELNPIQGINQFGSIMNTFFSHIHYRYILPQISYSTSAHIQYPKAFSKVWQYQRQATVSMFDIYSQTNNDQDDKQTQEIKIKSNYVNLMLNLNTLSTTEHLASFIYSGPIENRIMAMQNEIWSTPSEYSEKLAQKS